MSANLRFIVQTTQGDTTEFATESRCNRFAERCLADTWRTVQTEYRRFHVAFEFQNRKVFEYALLDLLQSEVVGIELLAGAGQIEIVFGYLVPRQFEHQLQICHLYRILRNGRIQPLDLVQLLVEEVGNSLAPLFLLCRFAHLRNLVVLVAVQLLLYRAHLLLQIVIALLFVDFRFDLLLNLLFEFQKLLVANQYFEQFARTGEQPRCFEQHLSVFVRKFEIGADEIDYAALGVDILDGECRLLRQRRGDVDDVERNVANRIDQRIELHTALFGYSVQQRRYLRLEKRLGRDVFAYLYLLQSRQDDCQIAVRHLENFQYACSSTDPIHIVG